MAMTFHCDVVSAEQEIYSGLVQLLVANGIEGELGLTYGHSPLLTRLKPGPVRLVTQQGEEQLGPSFGVPGGLTVVPTDDHQDHHRDRAHRALLP